MAAPVDGGENFSVICRVCREPDDEGRTLKLFKMGLHRKMMACANVQVWQNDGMPAQICRRCAARLHISHQFKRQCEKSDVLLRRTRDSRPIPTNPLNEPIASIDDFDDFDEDFDPSAFLACIQTPLIDMSDPRILESHSLPSIDTLPDVDLSNDRAVALLEETEAAAADDLAERIRCPVCNKTFATHGKLNRHSRTHSDEAHYKCGVCNKGFVHGGNYKVHLRIHADERPFPCSVCDLRFRQRQDLKKHFRTHTGERPHICPVCERAFTTSSNLAAHRRTHTGEKPYVCSVCRKAFCQSNELSKHFRTHTGEKSHVCSVCNRGFNGASAYVVHMRTHTGEKPYACSICDKAFAQSSCLTNHLRRHSETHMHRCDRCPRSFATPQELWLHTDAHESTNHSCTVYGCTRTFNRLNDLLRHMEKFHNQKT